MDYGLLQFPLILIPLEKTNKSHPQIKKFISWAQGFQYQYQDYFESYKVETKELSRAYGCLTPLND
jgi:hypothetical protein